VPRVQVTLTPLALGDKWAVDACLWHNTLYLDIVKTGQADFPGSDRFTYYGYKFEALCTDSMDVSHTEP
jgi:RAT1-interacting protein